MLCSESQLLDGQHQEQAQEPLIPLGLGPAVNRTTLGICLLSTWEPWGLSQAGPERSSCSVTSVTLIRNHACAAGCYGFKTKGVT